MTSAARSLRNRRRRVKPGSHLPSVPAIGIVRADTDLMAHHLQLTRQGYRLKKSVRPYYAKDGFISFRFVWRLREPQLTTVWTVSLRVHHDAFMRATA